MRPNFEQLQSLMERGNGDQRRFDVFSVEVGEDEAHRLVEQCLGITFTEWKEGNEDSDWGDPSDIIGPVDGLAVGEEFRGDMGAGGVFLVRRVS